MGIEGCSDHGGMADREKHLIRPPAHSDNHTTSHLIAKEEELCEGNDLFGLRSIFVHNSK
jgi:hypothetical protein